MEILQQYLWGPYIVSIFNFLKNNFTNNITWDPIMQPKSLTVTYGVPRAAFRFIQQTNNGKVVLPVINFYISDSRRLLERERVNTILWSQYEYDPVDHTITATRNPQHWSISFSFNLWTNNMRERDFIMHNLLQFFPLGTISLIYYQDRKIVNGKEVITDKNNYLLIPIIWDGGFNDETNIESLEMIDTRDAIKTTFVWKIEDAILPYDMIHIPISIGESAIYSQLIESPNYEKIL